MVGVRLVLLHAVVSERSCRECQDWLYTDKPGEFASKPFEHGGRKIPRPKGTKTPCYMCPKQPPDVPEGERCPETAIELSERNWRAWSHYRECRAVGHFPDDPIVRRNASIIRSAEELVELTVRARLAGASGGR